MHYFISILVLSLAFYIIYYYQTQEKAKEISRLKREIAVLKKTQDHTENKNKQGGDFTYFISHELKTPLTVIKGYSSILLDGTLGKLDPKIQEILEKVSKANEEIIDLVDDLLIVSRLEGGKMQYAFKEQDLNRLIEEETKKLEETFGQKKIKLDLEFGKDILAKVDADALQKVFKKLLANSLKTTRQKIEIETKKKSGRLFISFKDNGTYPAVEARRKYFDKALTKKEKKKGSTGLEMYICSCVVKDHQGEIKLSAWPAGAGKGKQVIISLPSS